jgi:membrane protease YdiL (CAAX protease family)
MVFWSVLSNSPYLMFDNIYTPMLFHMMNNLFAYIVFPLLFK